MHETSKRTRTLFLVFLLIVLGYAAFNARHLLIGPQIFFDTGDAPLTTQVQVIELFGTVRNAKSLTVNGRDVLMETNGAFAERVLLSPGLNTFVFTAVDTYDRETSETLLVMYEPPYDDVLQYEGDINNLIEEHGDEESSE